MDQAAGLREWLTGAGEQPDSSDRWAVPDHVLEAMASIAKAHAAHDHLHSRLLSTEAAAVVVERTLMVVGATGSEVSQMDRVRGWLDQWYQAGSTWVGHPEAWLVVPVAADHPRLSHLAASEPRWGLWVEDGPAAFRTAFATLKQLAERGGPRRLLALHVPGLKRKGLLQNLQQAARAYFGIELLVLAR